MLWTLVVLLGIASNVIMTKPADTYGYVLEGMLLAVGFRAAIFNSVFGAQIGRALAVSFIQPFIFFAANSTFFIFSNYIGACQHRIWLFSYNAWCSMEHNGR